MHRPQIGGGMACIYKRGETWWLKYYKAGRPVYVNLETRNQRDAEKAKRELERAETLTRAASAPVPAANPEHEEAWTTYARWAEQHLRKPTRAIVAYHWTMFVEALGVVRIGDVTRADVERFKAARAAAQAAPQSINNSLKDISAVYNRLKRLEAYSGSNPVDGVERMRIPRSRPSHHTAAERDKLLEAAGKFGEHTRWVVLLGAWAGLRRNEIVNARWEWFDWDAE
jgi:integrase